MKEKLKIIRMQDPNDREIFTVFVAKTSLNEEELQDVVNRIKNEFLDKEIIDWTYEDIVEELEKRNLIKLVESEYICIYA